MTYSDRWKQRPCVLRYWAYKDRLLELWGDEAELPDTFWVIFTMPMPKSWSEKKRIEMDGKAHQPVPDWDNMAKAFCDILRTQDSGIWDVRATKIWGRKGSIELRELEPYK